MSLAMQELLSEEEWNNIMREVDGYIHGTSTVIDDENLYENKEVDFYEV